MNINKLADEIIMLADFAEKCEQIGYKKALDKYESRIEELEQDIQYYQERLARLREQVRVLETKYNVPESCSHPYNGNMCLKAKPDSKCPDCGFNGYND